MIKVSIIIPSLNSASFIKECVQSVVSQSLKEIEIICVDAHSTDGTLEILREFERQDERVKLILSEKKSYGYQMNLGLKAAKGEFIGIVESDDLADIAMFERLYSVAKQQDCDVLKSDILMFSTINGKRCFHNKHIATQEKYYYKKFDFLGTQQPEFDKATLLKNSWHMNQSSLFKREFLQNFQIKFNETLGASYQDTGFGVLTLLLAGSVYFLDEAYYLYREDNENSSCNSEGKVFCVCDEYEFMREFLQNLDLFELHYKAWLRHKFSTYKWNLGRLGDEFKKEFVMRFKAEFDGIDTQLLKNAGFARRELIHIYALTHSPKAYLEYFKGSKTLLGKIKNLFAYKIWWKLGFYKDEFLCFLSKKR